MTNLIRTVIISIHGTNLEEALTNLIDLVKLDKEMDSSHEGSMEEELEG